MRLLAAVGGALASFLAVGGSVFYRIADIGRAGWHGGPQMLSAGMAGLFAGGLAGLVVLIALLRIRVR